MKEQRLTYRLTTYWQTLRKDSAFPPFEKFNPAAIEDLWPRCLILELRPGLEGNFVFEHIGDNLVDLYGEDLTGRTVNYKSQGFPGAVVFKRLQEIVTNKKPIDDAGFIPAHDGKMVKYRSCFLPFGKEDKELSHVLVGLSHRAF